MNSQNKQHTVQEHSELQWRFILSVMRIRPQQLIIIMSDVLSGQTSGEVSSTPCPLAPLPPSPLPLILSQIFSSTVVLTKEQTWLAFMVYKLWFWVFWLVPRVFTCAFWVQVFADRVVVFQHLCSAMNTNRVSVLNDVSNAEKCALCFAKMCVCAHLDWHFASCVLSFTICVLFLMLVYKKSKKTATDQNRISFRFSIELLSEKGLCKHLPVSCCPFFSCDPLPVLGWAHCAAVPSERLKCECEQEQEKPVSQLHTHHSCFGHTWTFVKLTLKNR